MRELLLECRGQHADELFSDLFAAVVTPKQQMTVPIVRHQPDSMCPSTPAMDSISYHRNQEGAPLWRDNEFCFSLFSSSKTLEHSGSGHSYSSTQAWPWTTSKREARTSPTRDKDQSIISTPWREYTLPIGSSLTFKSGTGPHP